MKSTFSKLRVMALATVAFVVALYPVATVAKVAGRLYEVMQGAVTRPAQHGVEIGRAHV